MFEIRCYAITVLAAALLLTAVSGYSQSKTLERNLEPVIVSGASLSDFSGFSLAELFLYANREGVWQQISFQFDERGIANGDTSFFIEDDGLLDDNDELVFMAKDAGNRVDSTNWVDPGNSSQIRYEIEVADPLAADGKAWVYLYRSNTLDLDPNLTNYVEYFASSTGNAGQDTVRSLFYNIGHSTNGFPKDLSITSEGGGNGQDLLDILKFRSSATLSPFPPTTITENNFSVDAGQGDAVFHKDGLVRVIRSVDATITVLSLLKFTFLTPPFFYYPYSVEINLDIPEVSGATINTGRMSFDLNAAAANPGMKFVSANNPEPGFTVDGVADTPEKEIDTVLPDNNWMYFNGSQGTIVHLFPLAKTVGNTRLLYYKDDSATDPTDTGEDKQSFGDTGNDISGGIVPPATFRYKGYLLSNTFTSAIGSQIAEFERTPFDVNTTAQPFIVDAVTLTAFSVAVEKNNALLSWVTANELNNAGFEIERRANGSAWQKIAFIEGAGQSRNIANYNYTDHNLPTGSYDFRLKMLDLSGSFEYSSVVTAFIGLPERFALMQNFPNPFNPTTVIQYQLPAAVGNTAGRNRTTLKIYNLLGEEIRTLVDKQEAPGFYSVTWDGKDKSGRTASSGIYIYRLQSGNFVETRKMVFVQ